MFIRRRVVSSLFFFFQAEDGIRDLVRSRGLGDVYKRQVYRLTEITGSFVLMLKLISRPDVIVGHT